MAGLAYTQQGWKPGTQQSNYNLNVAMRHPNMALERTGYGNQPANADTMAVNMGAPVKSNAVFSGKAQPWDKYGDYANIAESPKTTSYEQGFFQRNPSAVLNPSTGEWSGLSKEGLAAGDIQGTPNDVGGNWWSQNKDMISGVAQGIQGLSGLANAYMGYKNYGLAKDMFGFERAATNRAIQNQANEYNTGIQNAGDVGMALAGNTMSPEQRAQYQQTLDSRKISTAPVG